MSIIPNPEQAREFRALFADHPVIALALAWLQASGIVRVADVVLELPNWEHFAQLSEREAAAVVAVFVPPPADVCVRCGRSIRYVTDGPDPGWWTHIDMTRLLGDDSWHPHPATPDYGDGDAAGNSGPGWPFGGAR